MINFGVLGAGRIGKVHGATWQVPAGPKSPMSPMPTDKAADSLAQSVGAKVASVEEVIKAKDADAILIATPTDTHADLIERAAKAGKMILCEKPVSLSVERIEKCLAVVEKAKVPLMIGFHRRYDPHFSALEKRLRKGEAGDLEIVTITCRDPSPPPGRLYRAFGWALSRHDDP